MLQSTVPLQNQIMPLKYYLRQHLGVSLTNWRKIKQTGEIRINGQLVAHNSFISPGDNILIEWAPTCTIRPINIPLAIPYEDEYLIIVDKPAGMLVHPASFKNSPTIANAIMFYYKEHNLNYGFHPVHRLDRNTSGLIIIAKLPHVQNLLSINKPIKRLYQAVVSGLLPLSDGTIDAPIARHPNSIIERIVSPNGKHAITNYKVMCQLRGASLAEIELLTGRTHQIRVHMSHIGHPLLGDDLYGGNNTLINRQALHAARIVFSHPITNTLIDISSPLPKDIIQLINLLKI